MSWGYGVPRILVLYEYIYRPMKRTASGVINPGLLGGLYCSGNDKTVCKHSGSRPPVSQPANT